MNKYMDLYQADKQLIHKAKAEKVRQKLSPRLSSYRGMDAASFGQNAYFYDAAEGLLTATILLICENFAEPKKRHIVSVFKNHTGIARTLQQERQESVSAAHGDAAERS